MSTTLPANTVKDTTRSYSLSANHIFILLLQTVTAVVDDGQGGDAPVREDGQRSDERRVGVDVGNVGICPHSQLLQSLLHEGRHGHLTHLLTD